MAFKMDKPLYSLSDDAEQAEMIKMMEAESHGALSEGNNRIPLPLTFLMALIILTAFMITMPIWGQRPNAETYIDYVKLMDTPEVQRLATGEEKIKYIADRAYQMADDRRKGELERHPLSWHDLQNIAPGIKEVMASNSKYALNNYNVLGNRIQLANFEGNFVGDNPVFSGPSGGSTSYRERIQPWWDLGYTIDVFYVSYFCLLMVFVIKRLPHFSRKPDMSKAN